MIEYIVDSITNILLKESTLIQPQWCQWTDTLKYLLVMHQINQVSLMAGAGAPSGPLISYVYGMSSWPYDR